MLHPRSLLFLLLLPAALPVDTLRAQTLLRDISRGVDPGSTFPTGPLLDDGQRAWLTASHDNYSAFRAVLVSDGTAAGTEWFDTFTRTDCLFPSQFVRLPNGNVLFRAADVARGFELHASDGTQAGSHLVRDIRPGSVSSVSDQFGNGDLFTVLGNRLLFAADDGVHGIELWTSDGTEAGTTLLVDLLPGPGSSRPSVGARVGNRIVFAAGDATRGYELFVSDGTVAGTGLLVDLNPNGSGIPLGDFTAFGNSVIFTADDGTTGREPWITDGTPGGTRLLADLEPGSGRSMPREYTPHGSLCYFTAETSSAGRELYVTDGTNVTFFGDLDGSRFGRGPAALTPVGTGNELAFLGDDFTHETELWWTDGTPAGTRRITDLTLSREPGGASWQLGAVGGRALFVVGTDTLGIELWSSDGTVAGTGPLFDLAPGTESSRPTLLGNFGGRTWFSVDDGVHGREIWSTDGTVAGTHLLLDLTPSAPASSFPGEFTHAGNRVVFSAWDVSNGRELWVTDGTPGGTNLLADLSPGNGSASPRNFLQLGRRAIFSASVPGQGTELWATTGTSSDTRPLRQTAPGAASGNPLHLTRFADRIYFSANDSTGRTLWRTDGTFHGTLRVGPTALDLSYIAGDRPIHALSDRLLILAGGDLWTCDGTNPAVPLGLTGAGVPSDDTGFVHDDRLYFLVTSGNQESLWISDGTLTGTSQLAVIRGPCAYLSPDADFVARDGLVYLSVRDDCSDRGDPIGGTGREIWVTDGTPAGTRQLVDLWPGQASSEPRDLVATPDAVWFTAMNAAIGLELWTTDGTAAGTRPITGSMPGFDSSVHVPRTTQVGLGNRNVFAATDPVHGRELWISDGTAAGTRRVTDLAPGAADSIRAGDIRDRTWDQPLVFGGQLLFTADDGTTGFELFALPLDLLEPALVEWVGNGCPGHAGLVPQLGTTGIPARGRSFTVDLSEAAPSSSATLLFGAGQQNITLPGGCVVHPRQPAIGVPASISPAGEASLGFTVPANDPSLVGVRMILQWAVLDPSGAYLNTLTFSPGARVTLGES